MGKDFILVPGVQYSELSSESCVSCHKKQTQEWFGSRHSKAWSNPIFQEGYSREKQDRCLHCHTPLEAQYQEVKSGQIFLANQGVNCAVCHVRENTILSARKSSVSNWHPIQESVDLKESKFCAQCHQFNLEHTVNGKTFETSVVAQNTYQEWLQYRRTGGTKTCQGCHMPNGSHTFHGAHNKELLAKSLNVGWTIDGKNLKFQIKSQGVGHNFPTGDVFRHLTFETRQLGKKYFVLHKTWGKKYEIEFDRTSGRSRQTLKRNSSLRPGQVDQISLPFNGPLEYRVQYHYISQRDQSRTNLKSHQVRTVIAAGLVKE